MRVSCTSKMQLMLEVVKNELDECVDLSEAKVRVDHLGFFLDAVRLVENGKPLAEVPQLFVLSQSTIQGEQTGK